MYTFTLLEIILLLIIAACLLTKYAAKDVPYYVLIPVYVTWFLCYGVVAIVPLDIYYVRAISSYKALASSPRF